MIFRRTIFSKLEAELEHKEVTVITGMRRVGKTTAMTHLYGLVRSDNKASFDFENPLHRRVFEEQDYDRVWNNLAQFGLTKKTKTYIFIDEVQNLPSISQVVKYLVDHNDVKFVLTGSSSYYLRNLFPESLAGRKMVFELFPLSFEEFLRFKGIERESVDLLADKSLPQNNIRHIKYTPYFDEYMNFGSFPSVVLEENQERKKMMLVEIFTSYFEKDAKQLADFKDMAKLRDLILLLIPRVGQRIEVIKLSQALSVSRETVYNYLAFLEQTYFISMLSKYSGSVDRQAAGSKKLFLCDSGMARALGNISEGQLFEQSVFQTIRTEHNIHYYHKDSQHEIDFIVDSSVALEAKVTASKRDISTLTRRVTALNLTQGYVVTSHYLDSPHIIMATDL